MIADNIKVLDCTLRDGGYINNWEFNNFNTIRIINSLIESNVDIIECGYLNENKGKFYNSTMFNSVEVIEDVLIKFDNQCMFVCMLNFGDCDVNKLPKSNKLQGIRLAFHKKDWRKALENVQAIIDKGYKVFIQPMITLNYQDYELIELINESNKLNIHAFYIVDSFGAMGVQDLTRISYLIDHNLRKDIYLGLHCHNNLQLAYSNSIEFIKLSQNRQVIVDASVFGMGRGAGNLTTELFLDFLIKNFHKNYEIEPLLEIIDNYISKIYSKNYWGYSVAHYLSAIYNCHPHYATFLVNKRTLTVKDMENILRMIDVEKRSSFDENYIESLYIAFNSKLDRGNARLVDFMKNTDEKVILLVAPGKSIVENTEMVKNKIEQENIISISVNHVLNGIDSDYYFFSNQKRYLEYLDKISMHCIEETDKKFIFTSNIKPIEQHMNSIFVDYKDILGKTTLANDNSSVMLLNLLLISNVKKVFIAGLDGYSLNPNESYVEKDMEYSLDEKEILMKNEKIKEELDLIRKLLDIEFLTKSIYE